MRLVLRVVCFAGLIAGSVSAGTIQYEAVDLGQDKFRISYSVSGFTFLENQELAIQFDPAFYESLSNGAGPAGFDIVLLQPNNPLGASGDFSAVALMDHPDWSGLFSVDVVFTKSGWPGEQSFTINQLDSNRIILSTIASEATVSAATVPEPATLLTAGMALLIGGLLPAARRRLKRT